MTNKDIKNAAERNTEEYVKNGDLRGFRGSYRLGFIAGADWRINSVWHDTSEKPDMSKEIIVIYPDKSCRVFFPNGVWETLIEVDKFIRWAYVDDLKPNMED